MKIIYVPIEPLAERYTEQWYRRIPEAFRMAGFEVEVIDGQPLTDTVKVGTFLDINSTTHYKWSQLMQISKLFQDRKVVPGSVFFFGDIEFWGIEAVRLLATMNQVPIKMTGFLHAGSYTKEDAFAVAAPYQQYTEVGWVACMDRVFVGSDYHRKAFYERRLTPLKANHLIDRIVVTSNPVFLEEYPKITVPKQKKVLLTNRFDHEKRPAETLQLFAYLKGRFPEWEFVVTTGRAELRGTPADMRCLADCVTKGIVIVKAGLTKAQYHQELAEAYMMVSHSIEENYGYCIVEAAIYDCIPLLRAGCSHDEMPGISLSSVQMCKHALVLLESFDTSGLPKASGIFDRTVNTSGMQNIIDEIKGLL